MKQKRQRRAYKTHQEKRAGIQVFDVATENGVTQRKSIRYWTLYGMDGKEALARIKKALEG